MKRKNGISKDCRVILNRMNLEKYRGEIVHIDEDKTVTRSMTKMKSQQAIEQREQQEPELTMSALNKQMYELPNKKRRLTNPKEGSSNSDVLKPKSKPRRTNCKKVPSTAMRLKPSLRRFEMVWAHIRGYKNWPGIIEEETPKGKYKIHLFGDYSTSEVGKNKNKIEKPAQYVK